MKTAHILCIFLIMLSLGCLMAQQNHPGTTVDGRLKGYNEKSASTEIPVVPAKADPTDVITWKGNVLHKIVAAETPADKGLQKMIKEAGNEVKNMQKTIASIEQKPEPEKKSIFHYRQATESFIEGKPSTIIR
jgi:hypothetical protein